MPLVEPAVAVAGGALLVGASELPVAPVVAAAVPVVVAVATVPLVHVLAVLEGAT